MKFFKKALCASLALTILLSLQASVFAQSYNSDNNEVTISASLAGSPSGFPDDSKFKLIGTSEAAQFEVSKLGVTVITASLIALVPGAESIGLGVLVGYLTNYAGSNVYYKLSTYSCSDGRYAYYKRVLYLYSDSDCKNQIGSELVGYQKKIIDDGRPGTRSISMF